MITTILVSAMLAQTPLKYPVTKTVDHTDLYHGIAVKDPYRWLEQPVSVGEVRDWVTAQNKVTFGYLDKISGRDRLLKELQRRINFDRYGIPTQRGEAVVYPYNTGLQNQDVLYIVDKPGAQPRVLVNPNTFSTDGTAAINGEDWSIDGKRFLYGTSVSGSDWVEWRVRDVATGKDLPDVVKWSKFGGGVLDKTAEGVFYLAYPAPPGGDLHVASNEKPQIKYHKFGTDQSTDSVVFELPDKPDWFVYPGLDESRDWLVIYVQSPGSTNDRIYIKDLRVADAPVIKLFDADDANYSPIFFKGDEVFYTTNLDAPTGRVMSRHILARSAPREVVPASKDTLQGASVVDGRLVLQYMQDARSSVRVHDLDGKLVQSVALPGLGSAEGFGGFSTDKDTYFSFTDLTSPTAIYRYEVGTNKVSEYRRPKVPMDVSKYTAKQVFVKSTDGTRVPMFIVHKKGIKLDGSNPTLLYGYGGFNVSQTPWFSTSRTVFMDMGGVWCLANIRGGGEYGKQWHESATKVRRQNAYDDFVSCAEWLVNNSYTKPARLAIQGGSNGGLLVGACMNQRPDLFGVCIPEVGVMDMLRFNQFTIGKAWEADYGSPENADEFFALYRISPYHNLKPSTKYPATLVTTADTDDRVVPAHSFKYAARLQACQAGGAPVLIRIETSAGHGGGKPISKVLEEVRDIYSFIFQNMGVRIPTRF